MHGVVGAWLHIEAGSAAPGAGWANYARVVMHGASACDASAATCGAATGRGAVTCHGAASAVVVRMWLDAVLLRLVMVQLLVGMVMRLGHMS